jgi:hypothetical protein
MASTAAGRRRQRGRYGVAQQTLRGRLQEHQRKQAGMAKAKRKSADKVVICPTEPEAVLGKDKFKVFRPLYNIQLMQDVASPLVLGYAVYAAVSDSGLLPPLVQRTEQLTGRKVKRVRADGIYAALADVRYCQDNGVELYAPVEGSRPGSKAKAGQAQPSAISKARKIVKEEFKWEEALHTYRCPQGHLLQRVGLRSRQRDSGAVQLEKYRCDKSHCLGCPRAADCTSRPEQGRRVERMVGQEVLDELAARMRTEQGKQHYKKRKETVELRYADLRQHRGLQRFRGFGARRAGSQLGLLMLVHNGLSLLQLRQQRLAAGVSPSELALSSQAATPEHAQARHPPDQPTPHHRNYTDDQAWLCYN